MRNNTDYAALILRVGLGTMFVAHGLLKLLVFTLPGAAGFFEQVGFPGWSAYIVTFVEIAGGVLLAPHELDQALEQVPAFRMPENGARRFLLEVKQIHDAAEAAMIALLGFLEHVQVLP